VAGAEALLRVTTRRAFFGALAAAAVAPLVALRLATAPPRVHELFLNEVILLDDVAPFAGYEEGAWTPTLDFGSGVVHQVQSGWYVRVGDVVHVTARIQLRVFR
jgi:hypothetical protein